ncbi:MAG TPA: serine hydrolase domain-containing protein [Steroidobacter sp.]|uniref:serine hydrolase domain-containing protein n=1 Tax=Steroidobacter sp. TaxID=1978227 RepID=UPI002ED8F1F6
MKHWQVLLQVLLMALAGEAKAEAVEECVGGGRYTMVDAIFESFMRDQHVPGMVYGIVQGGRLVHCRALGVRDIESGEPVTFDSLFRIASMSKAFTALAILKLRDEGKLQLDAPAERWVPQLAEVRYPDVEARRIRVRDLLAHTAGFVTDDPWGDRQLDMPEARFTQLIAQGVPLVYEPGSAYEYSNYGYALLGRIVTAASKTQYQRYVQREILQALGMRSSGWQLSELDSRHRAIGYRYEDAAWHEEPVLADGAFASMGGLHTSARDYTRFVSFLLDAWADRDEQHTRIAARSTRKEMVQAASFLQPVPPEPGDPATCAATRIYGFGLQAYTDCRFKSFFGHSGGLPGYGSNVLFFPEYDLGIFAFANRTYARAEIAVKKAAATLYDSGTLQARTVHASEALRAADSLVTQIYAAGSVTVVPHSLANNLLLDRSARKRDAELQAVRVKLGECQRESRMNVRNVLAAVMNYRCERGTLAVNVLLAPLPSPSFQRLEFSAQD